MTMTREDVLHVLGPVDDHLIVEELEEAYAWLHANDVLGPQLRRQPTGKVAELCEILEGEEEEPDRM